MNERLPLLASRHLRALRLLAVAGGLLLLVLAVSRLTIEWFWFAEFRAQWMVLRRWLLQLGAFVAVMGLGVPLQLQQLQRCWRLRQQLGGNKCRQLLCCGWARGLC